MEKSDKNEKGDKNEKNGKKDKPDEILLIDKPEGITSYDVIRKLKSRYPKKTKIGHAGTLDPMATGLLIIGVGRATKRLTSLVEGRKKYRASVNLTEMSTTGDRTGEIVSLEARERSPPTLLQVTSIIGEFIGEINQIPPTYSAIKIEGKRAYTLARKGVEVEMPSRKVEIDQIELIHYSFPELEFEVVCSKGTYIRTLGEDIGKALGWGGYLTCLRRLQIGEYHVDDAKKI